MALLFVFYLPGSSNSPENTIYLKPTDNRSPHYVPDSRDRLCAQTEVNYVTLRVSSCVVHCSNEAMKTRSKQRFSRNI